VRYQGVAATHLPGADRQRRLPRGVTAAGAARRPWRDFQGACQRHLDLRQGDDLSQLHSSQASMAMLNWRPVQHQTSCALAHGIPDPANPNIM
jgi:muconolactone delta-isomerase